MFQTFGKNLKELRLAHHLTQSDLAKEFRVSNTTVSNYETGVSVPDILVIMRLADFFEVSVDDLIGRRPPIIKDPEEVVYQTTPQVPLYRTLISSDLMDDGQTVEHYLQTPIALLDGYQYFAYEIGEDLVIDYGLTKGDIIYIRVGSIVKNGDVVFTFSDADKKSMIGKFFKEEKQIVLAQKADRSSDVVIGKQRLRKNIKILGIIAGVFKCML